MTERSINEWLDINADTDVTQPLSNSDIISLVLNEEDNGKVDSDNETNESADEPVTRRQIMDVLKMLWSKVVD